MEAEAATYARSTGAYRMCLELKPTMLEEAGYGATPDILGVSVSSQTQG